MLTSYLYANMETDEYENINSLNKRNDKQNYLYKVFDHIEWWSAAKGSTLDQAGIEQDEVILVDAVINIDFYQEWQLEQNDQH